MPAEVGISLSRMRVGMPYGTTTGKVPTSDPISTELIQQARFFSKLVDIFSKYGRRFLLLFGTQHKICLSVVKAT